MGEQARWTWDPEKNRANRRKHGLGFETAKLVFRDPLSVSRRDPSTHEDRWQTIGMVAGILLFVVHTDTRPNDETTTEPGRIISARKATRRERQAYEEEDQID